MRRVFGILIAVLLLLAGALALVAWMPLREARAQWRAGKNAEAITTASEGARWRLWPRQYHQVLAAAHLAAGKEAEPHLRALRGRKLWVSVLDKPEVARRLSYESYLVYDAAVDGDAPLERATAQLALHRIADAEATLRGAERTRLDAQRLQAIERAIDDRRDGAYPFLFDRGGNAVGAYDIVKRDVIAIDRDFAPLVDALEAKRIGTHDRIELTLDRAVQRAAVSALGSHRASLVAIDPRTHEVLAVASSGPDPLDRQYEPGSVIKVLTVLAALANGVDVDARFPYTCEGVLPIDGRRFGDWRAGGHGALSDLDEALAQSCNVVFADIGLATGTERLRAFHRRAGFDGEANVGLFRVGLGKTVGEIFNRFETAFYAIGLEHETVTPFHLAMLASMLANRGALTTPRVFVARRSIFGEVIERPPQTAAEQLAPRAAAERVIAAMRAVVEHPRGTGRRAAVDGVTLALKTGTSGTEEGGYDAVLLGFAPAGDPKIAFAIVAENAGPAELAAAGMAKAFIEELRRAGHL